MSPAAYRSPAPLVLLLADPLDLLEPPATDRVLAAVLDPDPGDSASGETGPGPRRHRTSIARPRPGTAATAATPPEPHPSTAGRRPTPRRLVSDAAPADPTGADRSRPSEPVGADDHRPATASHPEPVWRSVPPVRVGPTAGRRDPIGRPVDRATGTDPATRPTTTQLRRWAADTSGARPIDDPVVQHRAGPVQPTPIEPSTAAAPAAARPPTMGADAPGPLPTARQHPDTPTAGPPGVRSPSETTPTAGPTTPPPRSLSLRTLDEAWRHQHDPVAAADDRGQPVPSADGGITPASAGSRPAQSERSSAAPAVASAPISPGQAPIRSLEQVSELAGADVDLESTLMVMLERGLRAEARRYGVDLEGWEIR